MGRTQFTWKVGDEYTGDPPMEEQGLNTIFNTDITTWQIIGRANKKIRSGTK
jgi:mannan endo-1,4-beta-mannosidase